MIFLDMLFDLWNFVFRDEEDQHIQYEPVAVIEFQGTVNSQGNSNGHYICDIKDRLSDKWFKTNDNKIPIPIRVSSVSKEAYVILYKRSNWYVCMY